ncbi:Pectate lyase family protein [Melia azedarach]|uniref:Pectate lyase family protein n=1 Tax=Melia azedarach TaxID=155640 RepID=A0ACC1X8H5_MELAZ|nr:Pectate lyase family protein [Melia azedarach]
MELARLMRFIIFFFTLATFIPSLPAINISEDAMKATPEAYVQNLLERSTRRNLMKGKGGCIAINSIDKCWRCQNDWANNRQKLASCVMGFGHKTTGGKTGKIYVVTDTSDHDLVNPKPGTLRHAVIQEEPLWIIFSGDMSIKLQQELIMAGDKTIDGRGAKVEIAHGAGIMIQHVKNVIVHGIHVHHIYPAHGGMIRDSVDHYGLRSQSDGDGISVFNSSDVWLDHLTMSECSDGLIDAIQGSTDITISNNRLTRHNHVMLLGAGNNEEGDKLMRVTVAYNHFGEGLTQRMPACRLGFCHVVNNEYIHWKMYAIGGTKNPTFLSQGNKFVASDDRSLKQVTKRDFASYEEWKHWLWRSEGDLFMNGAYFNQSGDPNAKIPQFSDKDMIKPEPATHVPRLTHFTGAVTCSPGKGC